MNKKIIKKILSNKKQAVFLALAVLIATQIPMVLAQAGTSAGTGIEQAGQNISCALCKIASLVFMVVGAVAALVIIMAGLRWTTSGDDPGSRQAAKTTIISAFVGIIIVVIAVYIVSIVINGIMGSMIAIDPAKWMTGDCPYCKKATHMI